MGTTTPSHSPWRVVEGLEGWTESLDRVWARTLTLQLTWQLAQVVLVGLCVRLAVAAFVFHDFLDPRRDHWEFGYEIGHIARSIVTGHGFSNPYWGSSGPTAILTPIYPLLMAAIFRVFGIYTTSSAIAMILFDCLVSAATAVPIFLIAKKTFDARTAKLAAWVWAFFPYAINLSATTMWYHSFVALLLACLILSALYLQATSNPRAWSGFGVLFGFAALTNPVILSIVPAVGIWLCVRLRQNGKKFLRPTVVGVLAMIVTILPWRLYAIVL
jgi:4-amino-4-deoxy-L-arabinose transferase-like glycosyltransferase